MCLNILVVFASGVPTIGGSLLDNNMAQTLQQLLVVESKESDSIDIIPQPTLRSSPACRTAKTVRRNCESCDSGYVDCENSGYVDCENSGYSMWTVRTLGIECGL